MSLVETPEASWSSLPSREQFGLPDGEGKFAPDKMSKFAHSINGAKCGAEFHLILLHWIDMQVRITSLHLT